jgi:hypothetical protein
MWDINGQLPEVDEVTKEGEKPQSEAKGKGKAKGKRKKKGPKLRTINLKEMKQKLAEWPDFKNEPSLLQTLHIKMAGRYAPTLENECSDFSRCTTMIYAPKFHCELQEKIGRVWQHSKAACAKACTYSITGMYMLKWKFFFIYISLYN